jgi:hypothetical protein
MTEKLPEGVLHVIVSMTPDWDKIGAKHLKNRQKY